ncbi:MAG: TRAP transporter large permease [Candidatus Hodarchaeota archaeon]
MEWYIIAIIIGAIMLIALASGMPVAFVLGAIGLAGFWLVAGEEAALSLLATTAYRVSTQFTLCAVPLFVLMAEVILFTGLGDEAYEVLSKWVGHLPGGLAIASIYTCAIFGCVSGASTVAVLTIGLVAIEEMIRRNYSGTLAAGSIAAAGALAILIPPSILMIIYSVVAEVSIGDLFIAGFIPGIILATLMAIYVVIRVIKSPELAPRVPKVPLNVRMTALPNLAGVLILGTIVLGVIYTGVCTPTEAAGMGATGALVLSILHKRLKWHLLLDAIRRTVQTTVFILMIITGAWIFTYLLTILDIPQNLSAFVAGLPVSRWVILILMQVTIGILGMFMEGGSIILLTCPVFIPIVVALGFDKVWFGILFTINLEMGMITPPFGFNLFVMHSIVKPYGMTMGDVIKGSLPFLLAEVGCMAIVMVFPKIALFLPSLMK